MKCFDLLNQVYGKDLSSIKDPEVLVQTKEEKKKCRSSSRLILSRFLSFHTEFD